MDDAHAHEIQMGGAATETAPATRGGKAGRMSRAEQMRLDYERRKLALQCTRPGCDQPAGETGVCADHRDYLRQVQSGSGARRRAENRARGLCAFCPVKSETYRCPRCAVRQGRVPSTGQDRGVDQRAGEATPDRWRKDRNGWDRYRGQAKRGQPAKQVLDAQDVRIAERAMKHLVEGLLYARSPEVQQLGRITRAATLEEAAQHADLAIRALRRVADRARGIRPDDADE